MAKLECSKCKEDTECFLNVSCPCCAFGVIKVCEDCFTFIEFGDNPLTVKDLM